MTISTRSLFRSLVPAVFLLTFSAGRSAAQTGAISGRITDAGTGQAIPLAQVNVIGTNIGSQTTADGRYMLRGIKPGPVEIRILRVGFTESRRNATVVAGQTLPLDIQMASIPMQLSPVVTTETGSQRRVGYASQVRRGLAKPHDPVQCNLAELIIFSPIYRIGIRLCWDPAPFN